MTTNRLVAVVGCLALLMLTARLSAGAYWHERKEAFAALGACGQASLGPLRDMLRDDRYEQSDLVRAIADAAGPDAGKEMTAILQDELAYWKTTAPTLKSGWWNADPAERRQLLRNRYDLLDTPLRVLTKLPYQPSRDIVVQVRDFWSSLQQLSNVSQITEECNQVLKALDASAPPGVGVVTPASPVAK